MTEFNKDNLGEDFFSLRAVERYGGRESVGSVLWLNHVEDITFKDEAGMSTTVTPADLAQDEKEEAELGYPNTRIDRAHSQDVPLISMESWLRRTMLPALPLKINGDVTRPPVKFDATIKLFTVPRDLARSSGIIAEQRQEMKNGEVTRDLNKDASVTLSLRLVPTIGRVASFGLYPYLTGDPNYGIAALESDDDIIRLGVGYHKYVEVYREPQSNELPPLNAPHQF